jgi:hypothetical protein
VLLPIPVCCPDSNTSATIASRTMARELLSHVSKSRLLNRPQGGNQREEARRKTMKRKPQANKSEKVGSLAQQREQYAVHHIFCVRHIDDSQGRRSSTEKAGRNHPFVLFCTTSCVPQKIHEEKVKAQKPEGQKGEACCQQRNCDCGKRQN